MNGYTILSQKPHQMTILYRKALKSHHLLRLIRNMLMKEKPVSVISDNPLKAKTDGRKWCYRTGFTDNR